MQAGDSVHSTAPGWTTTHTAWGGKAYTKHCGVMASKKLLEGERWEVEADGRDDILPVASKRGYMVRTRWAQSSGIRIL